MAHMTSRDWLAIGFSFFDLILYVPVNNFSVMWGHVFLGWTSTKQELTCLAQTTQCSDAGEARTRNLSISSEALSHWATALPLAMG